MFILELMSRILRGCAYGTAFGMCSPSGAPFYVCVFRCACTAVSMCSPRRVPIAVSTCVCACTAFRVYGPSGVLSAQKCACVCLHSARRVPSLHSARRVPSEWCPVVCNLRGAPIARERCGSCAPYVYMYSVWHGPPERCTYCT